MSQPTLNDVAKVAKVSATTVSRVINRGARRIEIPSEGSGDDGKLRRSRR